MIQGYMLRAWRLAQGETVAWVAEQAGITQSHLTNVENGRVKLTPNIIEKVGAILGIKTRVIFDITDVKLLQAEKNLDSSEARMSLEEFMEARYKELPAAQKEDFGTMETPRYVGRELQKHWKVEHKKICALALMTGRIVSNINLSIYKLGELNNS